jgi:hypothetical protein
MGMLLMSQAHYGWAVHRRSRQRSGPFRNRLAGKNRECYYRRHATHPAGASGFHRVGCYAPAHGDLSRSCRWYCALVARFGRSYGLTPARRTDCYSYRSSFIANLRRSPPERKALTRGAEPLRSGMASKTAWTAWIWFAGAAVWWVSAALAVHYNHRTHALLSLGISALFFFAGLLWLRMPPRKP